MCFTAQQVLMVVALAVVSGADWEATAREAVRKKLGVKTDSTDEQDSN